MYLLVVSTGGTPDYWAYHGNEIDDLLAARDEQRINGNKPIIIYINRITGETDTVLEGLGQPE